MYEVDLCFFCPYKCVCVACVLELNLWYALLSKLSKNIIGENVV